MATNPVSKSSRKWRIILIGIGVCLSFICLPFFHLAWKANRLRKTVHHIESMDGTVHFSHQIRRGNGNGFRSDTRPDVHPILLQLMEDDSFSEISRVILKSQTPQTDLSILAGLEKLEMVSLFDGVVNDGNLRALAACKQRIELSLGGADLSTTGLGYLKQMNTPYLEIFDCATLTAEEVRGISQLISVEHLAFMKTKIAGGWEHLKELKNLRTLVLNETGISDQGLRALEGFEHLETLHVTGFFKDPASTLQSPQLSQSLSHFAMLPKLRKLGLRNQSLRDDVVMSLGDLTQLEAINLAFSPITDAQLSAFAGLNRLKTLDLSGSISEAAVRKLHEQIPDCEIKVFADDGHQRFRFPN